MISTEQQPCAIDGGKVNRRRSKTRRVRVKATQQRIRLARMKAHDAAAVAVRGGHPLVLNANHHNRDRRFALVDHRNNGQCVGLDDELFVSDRLFLFATSVSFIYVQKERKKKKNRKPSHTKREI